MNIQEAKKTLENQIILWEGVNGVGIINEDNGEIIEIAIEENNSIVEQKIQQLLPEMKWHEHKVKIVSTNNFKFQ